MTRRREVQQHLRQLHEIRDIMGAMKNLALIETHKLARHLESQRRVVAGLEEVAADFLGFHPELAPQQDAAPALYLLIGSERGFCGDFNDALIDRLNRQPGAGKNAPLLLLVGNKLDARLRGDPRVVATLAGPGVAEEVPEVLNRLIATLGPLQAQRGSPALAVLYHASERMIEAKPLLPPFQGLARARFAHPPLLNLTPGVFLAELLDHYLFAALHMFFYASLLAENHQRALHMEGAVSHLDDKAAELKRRANTLRQEEIVEEIEVILLSAESLFGSARGA